MWGLHYSFKKQDRGGASVLLFFHDLLIFIVRAALCNLNCIIINPKYNPVLFVNADAPKTRKSSSSIYLYQLMLRTVSGFQLLYRFFKPRHIFRAVKWVNFHLKW